MYLEYGPGSIEWYESIKSFQPFMKNSRKVQNSLPARHGKGQNSFTAPGDSIANKPQASSSFLPRKRKLLDKSSEISYRVTASP